MKELLARYNYKHIGHCNCDGYQTEKYRAGDFEIRIRENKGMFKIKRLGRSLTQWESIKTLPQILTNIHASVQA